MEDQFSQPLALHKSIEDIPAICKEAVDELRPTAETLQIKLDVEQAINYNPNIKEAIYTTIVDKNLLKLSLKKLLEVGLFLSVAGGKVTITPLRAENTIELVINFDYYIPDSLQQSELFMPNYGSLNSVNNIKKGSGLEGVIAKNILDQLNIPIKVITKPETKQTSFVLYIHI